MSASSSPLSSALSQLSDDPSDEDEDDVPLESGSAAVVDAAAVAAAPGPTRSTRRYTAAAAAGPSSDEAPTSNSGGGGAAKRKRPSSASSSLAAKRPRPRTKQASSSSSLAVKAEQFASSSTALGPTPPVAHPQRRSARGSIPAPFSPPPKPAAPSSPRPPPSTRKQVAAPAPPPTERPPAKRDSVPPAPPAPAIAAEPFSSANAALGPTRRSTPPPSVPVPPSPAATNNKKASRHSIASLLSAPPLAPTPVSVANPPPPPPAAAAPLAPPPTAAEAAAPRLKFRSEPGVQWSAGRETCPMCRDSPTIPASAQPAVVAPPNGEDLTMTEASTNALGFSAGPPSSTEPVAGPSSAAPDLIVDSWLSCVKCKRWHHWECIRSRYPETLPAGLLALGLPDGEAANKIDRWYCAQAKCSAGKATLKKEPKEPKRASSRTKPPPTYAASDDGDSNAPSPTLPSFDLPAGPAVPIPTAGDEHNFHRRVSQWPALYKTYEAQGRIIDGGYRRCLPEVVVDEWKREDDDGWRRGGGIVLVENERSPGGSSDEVEGGEGIAFERLGGRLPDRKLTIADVARINGPDNEIEVLSVDTQNRSSAVPGTANERWTLAHWARYYAHPAPKVLFNIISYEITGTTLGQALEPPRAVKEISWVDRHWPGASAPQLPPVQRYLLMSPAGTFTDWHVDMAASSVYYHVVRGEKVFYFIRPTVKHLTAYRKWASTEKQTMEWLGNSADEVYKVVVKPGATAFIPAGWIHAVYTPKDSLVYGGNFVHTLAIPMQLRVCEIEVAHGEEDEHRFPYFIMLCWFVAKDYTAHLASLQKLSSKAPTPTPTMSGRSFEALTPAVLESLLALARFLCDWVERRVLKRLKGSWTLADSKQLKRDVSLKDPFSLISVQLANEFRSRVVTQLKALGQVADESAADVEARETELARGAQQAAGSSSTVARRANGVQEKSPRIEGLVQNWTEPEFLKYAASRPRPGALAGAPSEPAMCTEEKQHQFQYQRPQHRPDGSAVLEFVTATRVRYVTTWAPSSLPSAAPASEAASSAPPPISALAPVAPSTMADSARFSDEPTSSASSLAMTPGPLSTAAPGQAPTWPPQLASVALSSASAGSVAINGHAGPSSASSGLTTSATAAVGGPSRAPSSAVATGPRPISSIDGETSRAYERLNGHPRNLPVHTLAGPSHALNTSIASSSARPVTSQARPSAASSNLPHPAQAAAASANQRLTAPLRLPPNHPKPSQALWHPPMLDHRPISDPSVARPPSQQRQQQRPLLPSSRDLYPTGAAPIAPAGSSIPHSHSTSSHTLQQQVYYPTISHSPGAAFQPPTSSSHSRPNTIYTSSHIPHGSRPIASGPYAANVRRPPTTQPSQSSAIHVAPHDAPRRSSVSPPKPYAAQAATSSAGPPYEPAGYPSRLPPPTLTHDSPCPAYSSGERV